MQTCQIRPSVNGFNLLYEKIIWIRQVSIALFRLMGNCWIGTGSSCAKQSGCNKGEAWFSYTLDRTENQHFFLPQVQQILRAAVIRYRWVIPMTRVVEITKGTGYGSGDFAPSELPRT